MNIAPHGKGYRVQVYKNGTRKSATFATKAEAKAWGQRMEIELANANPLAFTFGEACTKYLGEVSSTKDGQRYEELRIGTFLEHFGKDTLLSEIDAPQMAEWRDKRLKTVKGETVLREKNLLNNIFTLARDTWHWCDHYPFRGVKMPAGSEDREAVWRWQQIRRVLRYPCSGKTKEAIDAFHIGLRTAMRLQEILAAPKQFDKARRVVTLNADQVKTKRRETVPIGRIAAKLLTRKPFLVDPNECSTLFASVTAKVGIEGLTFHDSRATALTLLARKVDILRLQKISRHRDIRQLRKYYRESPDDIAKLI